MPGLTNNDDILSGINQIIAALNDSCCPDVIVRELGVGFADEPQPEEAVEFGPPPDRWEAIDKSSRRCCYPHSHINCGWVERGCNFRYCHCPSAGNHLRYV